MNDNDIIKGLLCCRSSKCTSKECPYYDFEDCSKKNTYDIIDLINRQKSEIERLTVNMNAFGLGMKREKERADTARAEAIKEFAERAKDVLDDPKTFGEWSAEIIVDRIDNLAKEMTGGRNEHH